MRAKFERRNSFTKIDAPAGAGRRHLQLRRLGRHRWQHHLLGQLVCRNFALWHRCLHLRRQCHVLRLQERPDDRLLHAAAAHYLLPVLRWPVCPGGVWHLGAGLRWSVQGAAVPMHRRQVHGCEHGSAACHLPGHLQLNKRAREHESQFRTAAAATPITASRCAPS